MGDQVIAFLSKPGAPMMTNVQNQGQTITMPTSQVMDLTLNLVQFALLHSKNTNHGSGL